MGRIQQLVDLYTVSPKDLNLSSVLEATIADLPHIQQLSHRSFFRWFRRAEKVQLGLSAEGFLDSFKFDETYSHIIPGSYASGIVGEHSRLIYVDLRKATATKVLSAIGNQIRMQHVDHLALHVNDLPPDAALPAETPYGFRITFTPGEKLELTHQRNAPDNLYYFLGGTRELSCDYKAHTVLDMP